jgi:hypothetical protein
VRRRLRELQQRLPDRPVGLADLPAELRSRFRDRHGADTVVLVAPGPKRTLWKTEDLLAFDDAPRTTALAGCGVLLVLALTLRRLARPPRCWSPRCRRSSATACCSSRTA